MEFLILALVVIWLLTKEKFQEHHADNISKWALQNGIKRRPGESNEAFSKRLEEGYKNSQK